jgi:hypothetical protein
MLFQITQKCNEQCTHCFVDANPNGHEMSVDTLINGIEFATMSKSNAMILTGGDIFLHSQWETMIQTCINRFTGVIVLESNGWWITNQHFKTKIQKLLDNKKIGALQIYTDSLYYPNYNETIRHEKTFQSLHKKICFSKNIIGRAANSSKLRYLGRAQKNFPHMEIIGLPSCMNIFQRLRQADKLKSSARQNSWHAIIESMEKATHFCVPMTDINGDIHLGETQFCLKIDNVNALCKKATEPPSSDNTAQWNDLLEKLYMKTLAIKPCNKCKAMKNYPETYRELLNL